MLTIYRLFQIIMGLILSGFIFYLLISYAGNYAQLGGKAVSFKTIDVFIQDADSVYITGIPVNFTGFSRDDFSSCYSRPGNPPRIFCYFGGETQESEPLSIPILLKPGPDIIVYRGTLDYGWTRLHYVGAAPPMTIVFNPLDAGDSAWKLMASISGAFPDTSGMTPKVQFDVCDGSDLMIEAVNDGSHYERDEFVDIIRKVTPEAYQPCSTGLSPNQVLVTISDACSPNLASSGLCAQPLSSGASLAFISGISDPFAYKDPADIAALIIGGREMGQFGKTIGEETYDSKNDVMLGHLANAAAVMAQRSQALSHDHEEPECRALYLDLYTVLDSDQDQNVRDLARGDHMDIGAMTQLTQALGQASQLWGQLVEKGCESRGTG